MKAHFDTVESCWAFISTRINGRWQLRVTVTEEHLAHHHMWPGL